MPPAGAAGAGQPMSADPPPVQRYALRRVGFGFDESAGLLRDSLAPFRAAPGRLVGMYLLLSFSIEFLFGAGVVGLFLRAAVAAVVFAGYTFALDAAARSERPDFGHLGVILGFGRGKLLVLALSGVAPLLLGLLVLYGSCGLDQTSAFLAELSQSPDKASPKMAMELWVAADLSSLPFTFVAPVCALYRWSGSRSMGGNLLACIVNWRWALVTTAVSAMADGLFALLLQQGDGPALLARIGVITLNLFSLAWTLALARRTFPSP